MDEEKVKSYLKSQVSLLSKKVEYVTDISWNGDVNIQPLISELTENLRGMLDIASGVLGDIQKIIEEE